MFKSLLSKEQWAVLVAAVLTTIYFIRQGHPPSWFDNFGIIVFGFLGWFGYKTLKKERLPQWSGFAILLIAVLGLLVDSYIVFVSGGL